MPSPRYLFGSGASDFAIAPPSRHGGFVVSAPSLTNGTLWSSSTDGVQYTDLQTVNGGAISTISTDANGSLVPFYGPPGVDGAWLDFGGGGRAFLHASQGVGSQVAIQLSDPTSAAGASIDARGDGRWSKKGDLVLNVRDYGAVGDGVTDDRAAIKAAIEAGAAFGGRTVVIPAGTYRVTGYSTWASPGLSQFGRYAFRVGANTRVVGEPGAVLTEDIDYNNRRVMFYVAGSNVTIDGLTISNLYDMAGGSRPTSIPVAAGDDFDTTATSIKNIRVSNCTFLRSWYPTKFVMTGASGATITDVIVTDCTAYGEPTSTSSGGYNFKSSPPGRVIGATVSDSRCHDVTVSAAIGFYGVQDGTISGNYCRSSQIDGGGIQLENGADNIAITGNSLVDHQNAIWVDDSTGVTIGNNAIRNTTSSATNKGIRVTKQGYTEDPNKFVTDIQIVGNVLKNAYIIAENFGTAAGTPTFGTITVANNSVRLDGVTNVDGILMLTAMNACILTGNRVVGASTNSIRVAPGVNQYILAEGNITTKLASEASVGFNLVNANAFRPIIVNNHFTNGSTIPASVAVGGALGAGLRIIAGTGTPEGVASGPVGSIYLRDDGGASTTFYVKQSGTGNTGWIAK